MQSLPWLLAWSRLHKHSLRALSSVLVVTVVMLSLLALQGISHSTGNSLVSYNLSKLPLGERNLTITSTQTITSSDQYQAIDKYLTKHLKGLITGSLTRELVHSELSDMHGGGFYYGAVDDLKNSIRLTSGRMPAECNSTHCEVIQVGAQGLPPPHPESFGLVIVGTGTFLNNQLFAGTMGPPEGTSILISDGIAISSSLSNFATLHGADGWVGTINQSAINRVGLNTYMSDIVAFEDQLSIDFPDIILSWPQDALSAASDQALGISDKFKLLDFAVGALFLAFLTLFSLRQRREHQNFRAALSRIGTPKKTLTWELLIEYAIPLIFGVLFASLISPAIPSLLSAFNFHANLSQIYTGWPEYIFLILTSIGLVIGTSTHGDSAWKIQKWIAFSLGVIFLAILLLKSGTSDNRYWLIPFIYTLFPALITYFVLKSLSLILHRKTRHTYFIFREHLSLWQGVAAILTLTSILAMMALSFDSGISERINQESQNQVPLDISLRTGPALIRPLDVGGVQDYANLLKGSQAYPILRTGSAIRGQSTVSESVSLIGLPPAAMALADPALRGLSSKLNSAVVPDQNGIKIGSSKELVVTLDQIPPEVDLLSWFLTPRGTHIGLMSPDHTNIRTFALTGNVPTGSSLIAFEFRETSDYLSRRLHAINEGNYTVPLLHGTGSITKISLDGRIQTPSEQLWGLKSFPYVFDGGNIIVRPKKSLPLPLVAVDPTTASLATNGLLTLTGATNNYFQARIGAVIRYFPTAGDQFVIMDLQQMQDEISQTDLGATDPIELWITTPDSGQYVKELNQSPLQGLEEQSQKELRTELKSDPTNIGLNSAYRISLTFALLVALLMYMAILPLLYREGAAVLFQLEASGVKPRDLRKALRASLRTTVATGIMVGVAIGVTVGRLFISQSIPFADIAILLISSIAISEVGGILYTRGFFRENRMVGP